MVNRGSIEVRQQPSREHQASASTLTDIPCPSTTTMPEDHRKPSVLPELVAAKLAQQSSEPLEAEVWSLKVGSNGYSCNSCSHGESVSTDGESLQLIGAEASSRSTQQAMRPARTQPCGSKGQPCPKIPFWFHLRAPGRFAPWRSKSAMLLHLLRFYNRGKPAPSCPRIMACRTS